MSYSSRASSLQTPPLRVARSNDARPSLDTSARSIGITSVSFGMNESHVSQDRSRPSRGAGGDADPLSDEQLSTLSELKALQPEMIEVQSAIKSMRSLNDSLRREAADSAAEIHRLQRQLESAQSDQHRSATEARAANDAKHALQLQNDRNAAKVSDLEATVESLRRRLSAADDATEKQHATAQRHATELETLRAEMLLKSKSNAQLRQEVDDANQAREHALDRAQQVAKEASSVRMQVADLTHQLQDAQQQLDAQQKRFDAQRVELREAERVQDDLARRCEQLQTARDEFEATLADTRRALADTEQQAARRQAHAESEIAELRRRAESEQVEQERVVQELRAEKRRLESSITAMEAQGRDSKLSAEDAQEELRRLTTKLKRKEEALTEAFRDCSRYQRDYAAGKQNMRKLVGEVHSFLVDVEAILQTSDASYTVHELHNLRSIMESLAASSPRRHDYQRSPPRSRSSSPTRYSPKRSPGRSLSPTRPDSPRRFVEAVHSLPHTTHSVFDDVANRLRQQLQAQQAAVESSDRTNSEYTLRISSLELQVDRLTAEVATAEDRAQASDSRRAKLLRELADAQADRDAARSESDARQTQLEELDARTRRAEEEGAALREDYVDLQLERRGLEGKVDEVTAEMAKAQREARRYKAESEGNAEALKQTQAELSAAQDTAHSHRLELRSVSEELERCKDRILRHEEETSSLRSVVQHLSSKLSSSDTELQSTQNRLSDVEQDLRRATDRYETAEANLQNTEAALEQDRATLAEVRDSLEAANEDLHQLQHTQQRLEVANDKIERLEDSLKAAVEARADTAAHMRDLRVVEAELRAEVSRYESQVERLTRADEEGRELLVRANALCDSLTNDLADYKRQVNELQAALSVKDQRVDDLERELYNLSDERVRTQSQSSAQQRALVGHLTSIRDDFRQFLTIVKHETSPPKPAAPDFATTYEQTHRAGYRGTISAEAESRYLRQAQDVDALPPTSRSAGRRSAPHSRASVVSGRTPPLRQHGAVDTATGERSTHRDSDRTGRVSSGGRTTVAVIRHDDSSMPARRRLSLASEQG